MNFVRSALCRSSSGCSLRLLGLAFLIFGCREKTEALDTQSAPEGARNAVASVEPAAAVEELPAKPVASVVVALGDPEKGEYTLEEALVGIEGEGVLMASIKTDRGEIECELLPDRAPITVANFVGLARGTRPWKRGSQWVKKPYYDKNSFHRAERGAFVQAGAPKEDSSGGPGYVIPDEVWRNARHNRRGVLCMANDQPNTGGSQFLILDGAVERLDGSHTIFGQCGPGKVISDIAEGPKEGAFAIIETIAIHRAPRRTLPAEVALGDAPAGDDSESGDGRSGLTEPLEPGGPGESDLADTPESERDSRGLAPTPGGGDDNSPPPAALGPGDQSELDPGTPPPRRDLRKSTDGSNAPGSDAPASGSPSDPSKQAPGTPGDGALPPRKVAPGGENGESRPRKEAPTAPGTKVPSGLRKEAPGQGSPTDSEEKPKKTRPGAVAPPS